MKLSSLLVVLLVVACSVPNAAKAPVAKKSEVNREESTSPQYDAAQLKQYLRVKDVRVVGPYAFQVIFLYSGRETLQNISIEARYEGQTLPATVAGPVFSGQEFMVRFSSGGFDAYRANFNRVSWEIVAADRVQGYKWLKMF